MATLLETYEAHQTLEILPQKTTAAIWKAAVAVLTEDVGTANHAARVVWASHALRDARAMADLMLGGMLGNAAIVAAGDASTDNDLEFVVASLIDAYSALYV